MGRSTVFRGEPPFSADGREQALDLWTLGRVGGQASQELGGLARGVGAATEPRVGHRERKAGLMEIRIEAERALQILNRVGRPPLIRKDDPEVGAHDGAVGFDGVGLTQRLVPRRSDPSRAIWHPARPRCASAVGKSIGDGAAEIRRGLGAAAAVHQHIAQAHVRLRVLRIFLEYRCGAPAPARRPAARLK